MRVMYDSTTPLTSIPRDAEMVAAYVNGRYANVAQIRTAWPHATVVTIAIDAQADAQVLDVERYDADPADSPGWCRRQAARGQIPTVYCNTSTWPQVQGAHRLAGMPDPIWWRADYNGTATLEMGEIAHQYRSDTAQNLDFSVVADYWPGVDPLPVPMEEDMANVSVGPDGTVYVLGVNPNGHPLLWFSKAPVNTASGWSVADLTDVIEVEDPNDKTTYTVQP